MGNLRYDLYPAYSGVKTPIFTVPPLDGAFLRTLELTGTDDFIFSENQVDDQVYYKKKIQHVITLTGDDYNYIKSSIDTCKKYAVLIYVICEGVEKLITRAYFNNNNIQWDFDACSCDIELQISSLYDCIEANRGLRVDLIFDGPNQQFQFRYTPGGTPVMLAADLRAAVTGIMRSMNCYGYEEETPYWINSAISDFFNWQAVGGGLTESLIEDFLNSGSMVPIPNYVNPADDHYNIAIALKANILNPTSSNPGIKFSLSFADIEKIMRDVFNVYWVIVPTELDSTYGVSIGNYLRFEHYSYFTKTLNYDAISATNFPLNEAKNKVKIDYSKIPISEEWTFSDSYTDDFIGLPITYNLCDSENLIIKRENKNITTDMHYIESNPSGPFDTNEGFVLVDIDIRKPPQVGGPGLYNKVALTGAISGLPRRNGRLSTANLHYDLHRHNRPAESGEMNGTTETFLSPVYKKIQEDIIVENCCEDPFDKYKSLVQTELGTGSILESEVNYSQKKITFKLKHE